MLELAPKVQSWEIAAIQQQTFEHGRSAFYPLLTFKRFERAESRASALERSWVIRE
jgi:hypothetical protein